MSQRSILLFNQLIVLRKDVAHLLAMNILALAELCLQLAHLLAQKSVLTAQYLLLSLRLFQLIDKKLDVAFDLSKLGYLATKFLVLFCKIDHLPITVLAG